MIKLIAVDYTDAYAFVEIEGKKYAIKPPFQKKGQPVSDEFIETGINHYGFIQKDESFTDWSSLINHLKTKAIEHRKEIGQDSPDSEKIKNLFKMAPAIQVKKFLLRIEKELIPNSEFQSAEALLIKLLKNPHIKKDEELLDKCVTLLDKCNQSAEENKDEWLASSVKPELHNERFPFAVETYGSEYVNNLADHVRRKSQVFYVGSNI